MLAVLSKSFSVYTQLFIKEEDSLGSDYEINTNQDGRRK